MRVFKNLFEPISVSRLFCWVVLRRTFDNPSPERVSLFSFPYNRMGPQEPRLAVSIDAPVLAPLVVWSTHPFLEKGAQNPPHTGGSGHRDPFVSHMVFVYLVSLRPLGGVDERSYRPQLQIFSDLLQSVPSSGFPLLPLFSGTHKDLPPRYRIYVSNNFRRLGAHGISHPGLLLPLP